MARSVVAPSFADGPVAFVDVETTGGHPAHHRIIEIAIVLADGGELQERWSVLVNPGEFVPPTIQRLTGIDTSMLEDAPSFDRIAPEVLRRLEGRLFVAHNARFDYGFVRAELKRAGFEFTSKVACTVKLSRRLTPELARHNLDAVIEHHGLQCESRHRALPDADALWQLWRIYGRQIGAPDFDACLQELLRRPSLPPQLPPTLADDLPECHGVYRFLGEDGALLYIGKANNLRDRVLSHWLGATKDVKSRRLADQTHRVEWQTTAGELGALLIEAKAVRELQPVYNRRLRGGGDALTWSIGDEGAAPELVSLHATRPKADVYGLYRTAREAKKALDTLARDHSLCRKVLGLEVGEGSCFAHQLGRCAGVCIGAEPARRHSARVKLAFAKSRLRPWPYAGPVMIRERSTSGLEQIHVCHEWQYVGSVAGDTQENIESALAALADRAADDAGDTFDVDAYRILVRHLPALRARVRPLNVSRQAE